MTPMTTSQKRQRMLGTAMATAAAFTGLFAASTILGGGWTIATTVFSVLTLGLALPSWALLAASTVLAKGQRTLAAIDDPEPDADDEPEPEPEPRRRSSRKPRQPVEEAFKI